MWRDKLIASVFASSSEPILVVARESRTIVDCNAATEMLFGWSRADLIGRQTETLAADRRHWDSLPADYFAKLDGGAVADLKMTGRHRDGRTFPCRVRAKSFAHDGAAYNVLYIQDLSEIEETNRKLDAEARALRERIKELQCVYGVSDILSETHVPLEDRLARLPATLKAAWQYPESAHVRIELRGLAFSSHGYRPGVARQVSEIHAAGKAIGSVTVACDVERPAAAEGPFLREERRLLDDVARRIGVAVSRADAEVERRRSAAWLRFLSDNLPVTIAVIDFETGAYLHANARARRDLGLDEAGDIRNSNVRDVYFDPAEREKVRALLVRDGSVKGYVLKLLVRGEVRWNSVFAELHEFEGRRAVYAVRIDVTEQRQNEARLRFLSEKIPVSIAIVDEVTGEILYANPRLRHDLDIGENEALAGRTVDDLYFDPDERADVRAQFARERRLAGRVVRGRIRGQARWHALYGEPIEFEGHNAIYTVRVDVTEQRFAEESLRRSQRLEAIGQLAGGIAHDFNNVLTALSMQFDLLRDEAGLSEDARHGVEIAATAVDRGAAITRQLLSFARKVDLKADRHDIGALAEQMQPFLARSLGGHIRVSVTKPAEPMMALVDKGLLESAILNLAINARDAMPTGGTIAIAVAAHHGMEEAGGTAEGEARDYVEVAVSDTGTGMTPEVLERVFEPFFTTKEVGRGTGLGLSMVHGFVQQSGGFARIESAPGAGTTVRLYFPRHREGAAAPAKAPAPTRAGAERLLLVDDDDLVRRSVAQQLRALGYRVAEAQSGAEALRALETGRTDLVITDVMMPDMLGPDFAARIRAQAAALPIVAISGSHDSEHRAALRALPGVDLLDKPFAVAELAAKIRAALDRAVATNIGAC